MGRSHFWASRKQRQSLALAFGLLAVIAALVAPSTSVAGKSKPKKPPNPPSCRTLVTEAQIVHLMGTHPALQPMFGGPYKSWYFADAPNNLDNNGFIRTTTCEYRWAPQPLPLGGYGPLVGDPDPDPVTQHQSPPEQFVYVGAHVNASQWRHIKSNAASDPTGAGFGECIEPCGRQRKLHLGSGSQAFVEPYLYDATNPAHFQKQAYNVWVLSKRHNLLDIQVWPATLQALEGLVKTALRNPRF